MSLSEKTESLPPTSQAASKDAEQHANGTTAKSPGATVIERWDALEQSKPVTETRQSKKRPPEARRRGTAQSVPVQKQATADPDSRPAARPNPGYSSVNYRVNSGQKAKGKSRSRERKNAAPAQLKAPVLPSDPSQAMPTSGPRSSKAQGSMSQARTHTGPTSPPEPSTTTENVTDQDAHTSTRPAVTKPSVPPAPSAPTPHQSGGEGVMDALDTLDTPPSAHAVPTAEKPPAAEPSPAASDEKKPADQSDNEDGSAVGTVSDSTHAGELSVQEAQPDELQTQSAEYVAEDRPPTPPPAAPAADGLEHAHYGRSIFVGILLLVLGVGGFVAWASLAPISSGVIASGVVKLQGERKTVQHLEGGIIKELLVREGDAVKEGQVLVRLDGSRAEAILDVQATEYLALLAKKNRLQSERRNLDSIEFDQALLDKSDDPDVAELMQAERSLLTDRNANHEYQLKIFGSWSEGYHREITGLQAQKTASVQQLIHIKDELKSVESLYKKGAVAKTRLLELKRTAAGLKGQAGALTANIARAEQKIGEAELRGISLQNERAEDISKQLAEVDNQIRRLKEQLPAQRDVVDRLQVRAPRSGRVVNLHFYTAGGVISPSTPILDIVPEDDQLLIEAKVNPVDIDILRPGMEAQITLTAYSARKTPPVLGTLLQVSADRVTDANTGEPYYQALVTIDSDALAKLSEVTLYPGMPASVQFVSGERTPMDYLLSPLQAGLRKGWLEE